MKKLAALLIACLALSTPPLLANSTNRTGVLSRIQLDSHSLVARQDIVWLRLAGSWGGTSCLADWAWFNAKDNPQFLTMAIAARQANTPLALYVDDSLPLLDGYCQLSNLVM